MADKPINLNKVRKARAKADKRATADRNAVLHGMTRSERERARAEAERQARLLDAGRRDREDTGPDDAP